MPHDAGRSDEPIHLAQVQPRKRCIDDGDRASASELAEMDVERHRRRLSRQLGRKVSRLVARADMLSNAPDPDGHVLLSRTHFEELCRRSSVDGKTGLLNYRAFSERLDGELGRAERHREDLALIMIDIDGLKELNDRRGHLAGDGAIRALARVLRRACRAGDTCARYGGDEFVVLVTHADEEGATRLARRILEAAREALGPLGVGVSLGVAGWPESADTREQLIAAADEALYFAKRAGGDRVRVFSSGRESIPA